MRLAMSVFDTRAIRGAIFCRGRAVPRAQERFQIASNLAALLAIVILSLCVNALLQLVDRKLLTWHHERTGSRRH